MTVADRALARALQHRADVRVLIDGEGPFSGLPGAVAFPAADRAVVSVGAGMAAAGAKVVVVVADASRLPALQEALSEAEAIVSVGALVVLVRGEGQVCPGRVLLAADDVDAVSALERGLAEGGLTTLVVPDDCADQPAGTWEAGWSGPEDGFVTVVTAGPAARAAAAVEGARVLALRQVWPVDMATLSAVSASVARTSRLCVALPEALAEVWLAALTAQGDTFWYLEEQPLVCGSAVVADRLQAAWVG